MQKRKNPSQNRKPAQDRSRTVSKGVPKRKKRALPIRETKVKKIINSLQEFDARFNNEQRAIENVPGIGKAPDVGERQKLLIRGLHNSRTFSHARVGMHYIETHAVLDFVSHGLLRGKKIVHLGASTGVYAQYLQQYHEAKAIALDRHALALKQAKERGVKKVIRADALGGISVPHLPFKDASLDYAVSEHFLFSNYHKGLWKDPGFEKFDGSIERSEQTLREINRVLKPGGKLIVAETNNIEIPALAKYKKGFKISGFVVEDAFSLRLKRRLGRHAPVYFVLRKTGKPTQKK
jgi:ubiquinone/menaquinone biosynthesis C-methylase UbiE